MAIEDDCKKLGQALNTFYAVFRNINKPDREWIEKLFLRAAGVSPWQLKMIGDSLEQYKRR